MRSDELLITLKAQFKRSPRLAYTRRNMRIQGSSLKT